MYMYTLVVIILVIVARFNYKCYVVLCYVMMWRNAVNRVRWFVIPYARITVNRRRLLRLLLVRFSMRHYLMFWMSGLVTDTLDEYMLYSAVGEIPAKFDRVVVGNTTRSMCRRLCSETYDLTCSGFLYNRHEQNCQLSSYTGEWVTAEGLDFHSSSGLEFYRRKRHVGENILLFDVLSLC